MSAITSCCNIKQRWTSRSLGVLPVAGLAEAVFKHIFPPCWRYLRFRRGKWGLAVTHSLVPVLSVGAASPSSPLCLSIESPAQ